MAELGRQDDADLHFERALQLRPDFAEAHFNLANTRLRQGRPVEALEHYQQAVRLAPRDVDMRFTFAGFLAQQGRLADAAAHFQQVLQTRPDFSAGHYNLANTLMQLGNRHDAIAHYREAVRLQPDLLGAQFNLATALLGEGSSIVIPTASTVPNSNELIRSTRTLPKRARSGGDIFSRSFCCESDVNASSQGVSPGRALKPLPATRGDPDLIRQVFAHLLSNAIKYTRHREVALIEIGGRSDSQQNVYYVKDNGVGFDPKYARKLFGVFQRLHHEHEFEGTGVGLALVQRILHRHGGRIWAEAKPNEGATFYFTLPK